jgi:DNA repair exonuclease SbcCD nuclease subunit
MKSFSFVHLADAHLGKMQYGLEARREDFTKAFMEAVEKIIELKPNFIVISGDLFEEARPANPTLATAIRELRRLRDHNIPVLAVDGSHDSAPNVITGTILIPLDRAGLLHYLPFHEGSCWRSESCYVYGIPNYNTRTKMEKMLPEFLAKNNPKPDPQLFNIFAFHGALDDPTLKPPGMDAELRPEIVPDGFDYYAGGHIHNPIKIQFKSGTLAYSGCLETTTHKEAEIEKGFNYITVQSKSVFEVQRIRLRSPRPFQIIKEDFSGKSPDEITKLAAKLVEEADRPGSVLVVILEGLLPMAASRTQIDSVKIRGAAKQALYVHYLNKMEESEMSEEVRQAIFGAGREMKTLDRAYEYFLRVFSTRYSQDKAERLARLAVDLVEPLSKGERKRVEKLLEEFAEK